MWKLNAYWVANYLCYQSGARKYREFLAALKSPRETQLRKMKSILQKNQHARYAMQYRFEDLHTIEAYQQRVPIINYDDLSPFVSQIQQGEQNVLTKEKVSHFELSGGSTASSKFIPYTNTLKQEFNEALSVWMHDIYINRPKLLNFSAYWSISPPIAKNYSLAPTSPPIGVEDDTEYFNPFERLIIRNMMTVPGKVNQITHLENNRYLTLYYLLSSTKLGFISVWNPSFLTLLVQRIEKYADQLVEDIKNGTLNLPYPKEDSTISRLIKPFRPNTMRASEIKDILKNHSPFSIPSQLWPNIQLISCWADAAAKFFLPEMKNYFPDTEIQPKGLLATEGVISFPLYDAGGSVIALNSHFYEFVDCENMQQPPCLVDELEVGKNYEVIITTSGGLYRYALNDVIQVVGKIENTPVIKFIGKAEKVSDLCGEKINELMLGKIFEEVLQKLELSLSFMMLAPQMNQPPYYVLFVEFTTPTIDDAKLRILKRDVEINLQRNIHYRYCRELGQLAAIRLFIIKKDAEKVYLNFCHRLGQKMGNIKPSFLHKDTNWLKQFDGSFYDAD